MESMEATISPVLVLSQQYKPCNVANRGVNTILIMLCDINVHSSITCLDSLLFNSDRLDMTLAAERP